MRYLKLILFIILCLCPKNMFGQTACYFEHYSTENGLPQFTITDMLQDRKGFMWFATWDGFSKFDGYTFRNFKVRGEDTYQMESNRIQHIYEDRYGNIWLHSYDDEAHCFNPYTETFKGLKSFREYQNLPFKLSKIETCPSGKVWLLSEKNGCVCITDSLFSVQIYNRESNRLKDNIVHQVFEDQKHNSWILTNNGLSFIRNGQYEPVSFFSGNEGQSFFSATEFADEIWFGSNNGKIWRYSKSTGKFSLFPMPSGSDIGSFQKISDKEILIATSGDGFFVYDFRDKNFRHYNTTSVKELKSNKIRALFFDSRKQFWFETDGLGIYQFDPKAKTVKYYIVKINDPAITTIPPASDILEDIHGRMWVQPRGGGFSLYNEAEDRLDPFYNEESSPYWRFSNILHSLFSDKQGNLWFCTRSHGLEKVVFGNDNFKTIRINPDIHSSVANDVRAVLQDNDKRLWVATKDRNLTIYDEQYRRIGSFSETGEINRNHTFSGIVYSMMKDDEGNIWLGTRTNGLFKVKKTDDLHHYKVEHFKKDPNDIHSLSENVVYSIFQDSKKNIWIGTYGGGLNLVKTDKEGRTTFINHRNGLKNYPLKTGYRIRCISENKYGNICVGTTTGLIMFSSGFSRPDDILYKHYTRVPGNRESLGNNDVHGICNTHKGEMFLATFGGGLNKVVSYDPNGFPLKFRSYTMQDGLPTDVCLAVLEDENGKLWISMENSLSKFDPDREEFETFAEIKRLMMTGSFSEASACRLQNNDLVFGFSNGILHFSPKEIKHSNFKPYIALSDFRIHNRRMLISGKNSPLTKNMDDMEKLVLSRNQNSFSIEYAALDFVSTDNILYAYKLEGFDNDWVYVQKKREAGYTNIPKGDYIFRVKSTNSEGVWIENERTLPVRILPSFWETPWAILIYILLAISIIYLTVRILFSFYRLRKNVEMEKYLSEMKLRFFTDISHEIRTPLTMISAPVEHLLNDDEISERAKGHLTSISRNTNRMLRLVNQILDFRKIQQSGLKVQEIDPGPFIESICHNFDEAARKNNIRFQFINQAKGAKIWVAPDLLEMIITNLLSNAFKYTPGEKTITVTIQENDKHLAIEVKDEGIGISKEKQKNLFVRFASFNEDKSKPSTGIGLSIVKDLVNKHAGNISVESEAGKGSTFTVYFMKGTEHFDKNIEFIKNGQPESLQAKDEVSGTESGIKNGNKKHSILIVEDNTELRTFIRTILENDYEIIEAGNGIDGLEKAERDNPDFIVSDIMMPYMDGIELLQRLKSNINTSHIPVVLLTAKTAIENKLEGLMHGADDYITKPFSVQYFRARIDNLLEQRKRLQEAFRSRFTLPEKTDSASGESPSVISQEEIFINKVIEIIEKHMDDSEFTIDDLSADIGMSRSVFFNKVKSLTGLSSFDFIRDVKLKRAAQLLSSGQYMVKEVSYMIGISDTKHFGKIFKAKYGVTPQEYKKMS